MKVTYAAFALPFVCVCVFFLFVYVFLFVCFILAQHQAWKCQFLEPGPLILQILFVPVLCSCFSVLVYVISR